MKIAHENDASSDVHWWNPTFFGTTWAPQGLTSTTWATRPKNPARGFSAASPVWRGKNSGTWQNPWIFVMFEWLNRHHGWMSKWSNQKPLDSVDCLGSPKNSDNFQVIWTHVTRVSSISHGYIKNIEETCVNVVNPVIHQVDQKQVAQTIPNWRLIALGLPHKSRLSWGMLN